MLNDTDRRIPANPESININEELELSWWSNEQGIYRAIERSSGFSRQFSGCRKILSVEVTPHSSFNDY
jgi:hypothetical protein